MDKVECVVVGAGVIGLAVARRLAQAGREVILLEAAEGIGTVTSSRNSEVIHAGIYYPAGSLMARMCVGGKSRPKICRGRTRNPQLPIFVEPAARVHDVPHDEQQAKPRRGGPNPMLLVNLLRAVQPTPRS